MTQGRYGTLLRLGRWYEYNVTHVQRWSVDEEGEVFFPATWAAMTSPVYTTPKLYSSQRW
jgi:hypothetical protein